MVGELLTYRNKISIVPFEDRLSIFASRIIQKKKKSNIKIHPFFAVVEYFVPRVRIINRIEYDENQVPLARLKNSK